MELFKNDRARKKLLEKKDLALDKVLDILRTPELTEIRASDMKTEEANVDRIKLNWEIKNSQNPDWEHDLVQTNLR